MFSMMKKNGCDYDSIATLSASSVVSIGELRTGVLL